MELHLKSTILKKKIIPLEVSETQRRSYWSLTEYRDWSDWSYRLTSCPRCPPCRCCLISGCWPPPSHLSLPCPGHGVPRVRPHGPTWDLGNIWRSLPGHRHKWSHCHMDNTETAWCDVLCCAVLCPSGPPPSDWNSNNITPALHPPPLPLLVSESPERAGSVI